MFFRKEPTKLFRHPGLYMTLAGDKGRGVFCSEDIKKGDTIEVAPVMIFGGEDADLLHKTKLSDYVFSATAVSSKLLQREKVADAKEGCIVAMGVTSFCNYRHGPNAEPRFIDEYHTGYYQLVALKDIPKDTEITIDYGICWLTTHGQGALKGAYAKDKDAP